MAYKAKRGGGDFEAIVYPTGTNHAVIQAVIELGTTPNPFHKPGTEKPGPEYRHRTLIRFELPESTYVDPQGASRRQIISQVYTTSTDDRARMLPIIKSAMNRDLTADEAENGFDLDQLLGANLFVVIESRTKNDKTYFDVEGAAPLPASTKHFEPENPALLFEIQAGADGSCQPPACLLTFQLEELKSSKEYREIFNGASAAAAVSRPAKMPTVSRTPPGGQQPTTSTAAAPKADATPPPPVGGGMPDLTNVPEEHRAAVIQHWLSLQPKAE